MATESTFIDFIADYKKNPGIIEEFKETIETGIAEKLNKWFFNKGYNVPEQDCIKIIKNQNSIPVLDNIDTNAIY